MCCNCCNCRCHAYPVNHGMPWSSVDRRAARRRYMMGQSMSRIARSLGRSVRSVRMELGAYD